jgi:hypothetical protein
MAHHASSRLATFNQQELSLTAWAFATMNEPQEDLFDELAREVTRRIDELNPQAISNTAWAFASMNHESDELFDALQLKLVEQGAGFHAQGFAITTWALANRGCLPDAASLATLSAIATDRVHEFNQQGLSNVAWAFATFGRPVPEL